MVVVIEFSSASLYWLKILDYYRSWFCALKLSTNRALKIKKIIYVIEYYVFSPALFAFRLNFNGYVVIVFVSANSFVCFYWAQSNIKWKWSPDALDFSVPTDIIASFNRCSICLGEYQEKEVLRIMPKCGHNFHLSCIDEWLRKHSTCPVCRFQIQDSFKAKHMRQAAISMVQSIDSPDTPSEHSRQWLLPSYQHQAGNHSNQRHLDPVPGNSEITPGEPQTSHSWTKEMVLSRH